MTCLERLGLAGCLAGLLLLVSPATAQVADGAGKSGDSRNQAGGTGTDACGSCDDPDDVTPPTVTLTAPTAGQTFVPGASVTLSATDAETIAITYHIPATVAEPGSITMPSRLLSDFVGTLPHEPITLTLAEKSKQVSLTCARNQASIGGMDPDDFPPIPPVDGSASLQIDAERFRRARGAILLGTNSFWEGVDLPGDALEVLFLTKLPFAVPDEPLIEARCERLEREGGDGFRDLLLP